MDPSDFDPQGGLGPWEAYYALTPSSTNSTASDLPGPGRTVGAFYDVVGGHIERLLYKTMRPRAPPNALSSQVVPSDTFYPLTPASTNSTASNLPGPGRSLGVLYDFVGRPLESILGKTAERLGRGPRVTAQRIQRRRTKVRFSSSHVELPPCTTCPGQRCGCEKRCQCLTCWNDFFDLSESKRKYRQPSSIRTKGPKIEKDCKRLLKYAQSNIPLTRKQAIDHILDLSIGDEYLRALLRSMGASQSISHSLHIYDCFRNDDLNDVLQSTSRKALVSLNDSKINALLQEWMVLLNSGMECPAERHAILRSKICPYLRNPGTAFLVVRVFRRIFERSIGLDSVSDIAGLMLSIIKRSPHDFEWKECDIVLNVMFRNLRGCNPDLQHKIVWCIFQHADKLPRVLGSEGFQQLSKSVGDLAPWELVGQYSRKQIIASGVIAALDTSFDTFSLKALQETFPCPTLLPVLDRLACPLERAMRSLFPDWSPKYQTWRKLPSSSEIEAYFDIVRCMDSDDPMLQARALEYVRYFLRFDIHRCNMMLRALSTTSLATRPGDFSRFETEARQGCVPQDVDFHSSKYRHWDRKSGELHISSLFTMGCCRWSCDSSEEQELAYINGWLLELELDHGMAFSAANLRPLLAGRGGDMRITYVARAMVDLSCKECDRHGSNSVDCAISEGTKPEDLRVEIRCHKTYFVTPERIIVPVLRYSPEAYRIRNFSIEQSISDGGIDGTGPFSWRHARPYVMKMDEYGMPFTRVISSAEAEEILSRSRHASDQDLHIAPNCADSHSDVSCETEFLSCEEGNSTHSNLHSHCKDS